VGFRLPKIDVPPGPLAVTYIFGVSSKNADGDNLIKAFQDCLAERYAFNDCQIYLWEIEKQIVAKGHEFIAFELRPYRFMAG
jgi:Holliday junction resolvase RusA-like endonuclease